MRNRWHSAVLPLLVFPLGGFLQGTTPQETGSSPQENDGEGRLVSASSTMVTAWDLPRDPLTDSTLASSPRALLIRKGFDLFMHTPSAGWRFTANSLSCGNCHLNGGQRERALPLVGVARVFPEFNKRAGRVFTLEDRIVGCFMRSENAGGTRDRGTAAAFPDSASEEILALAAYITWLAEGFPTDARLPWRGRNKIPADRCLPMSALDTARGRALFAENCQTCHGIDGQGVQIGDKKAGPLWGPSSWNDGAGAARIYTLAGFIRYAMPYLKPGSLTDEESQHIAAFIDSQVRPAYRFKDQDYRTSPLPADAVYYRKMSGASKE
jgi:thiosulfate dehydrogenase